MALNPAITTQLYTAIVAIVAGAVGTGGGSVPTTRVVGTSGLITGGGPLAADLALTLPKASAADIVTGTRDDAAITPLGLKTAIGGTLATGYYVFPGGLIFQWGGLRGTYSEGAVSVTLPTSFPTAFSALLLTGLNQSASSSSSVFAEQVSRSLSGFTAYFQDIASGRTLAGLDYFAIGY